MRYKHPPPPIFVKLSQVVVIDKTIGTLIATWYKPPSLIVEEFSGAKGVMTLYQVIDFYLN